MKKFESSIKSIPYPQAKVYAMLSDLSNIERIKDRIPEDKVQSLEFTKDTLSLSVPPVGAVRMRIVEREELKTIKFATEESPVEGNLWIQLLPIDEASCKMRLTVGADLNPFILQMVKKHLQDGVEKMADVLAAIPYE